MEGEYEPDIRNQDRAFRDMVPLKHIVRERHMRQTKGSYGVPPQDLLHKRIDVREGRPVGESASRGRVAMRRAMRVRNHASAAAMYC